MYVWNRQWANLACLNYECIKFVRSYYGRTMAAVATMGVLWLQLYAWTIGANVAVLLVLVQAY